MGANFHEAGPNPDFRKLRKKTVKDTLTDRFLLELDSLKYCHIGMYLLVVGSKI